MKKTRRFAAFVASVLAVACMAAPMATSFSALAADPTYTITIDSTNTNTQVTHSYKAYQIFTANLSDATVDDPVLTAIEFGDDIDSATLITKFNAAVDAGKLGTTVTELDASATATTVAEMFAKIADQSAYADALAKVIKSAVKSGDDVGTASSGSTISALAAGYYLVEDTTDLSEKHDAETKFILKVVKDQTVTLKSSYPSVEKKVYENQTTNYNSTYVTGDYTSGTGYNDVADYSIGDSVKFELYGTLPSTLNDYVGGYKYVFHDTMDTGLTYNTAVTPTVKLYYGGAAPLEFVSGTDYTLTVADAQNFTITFADIKKSIEADNVTINDAFLDKARVVVTYEAKLNTSADVGLDGNENTVWLTFSNNPNWEGDGQGGDGDKPTDDGKTPEDKVVVFTYELDVTKQDPDGNKLADAEFVLYKTVDGVNKYVVLDGEKVSSWTETKTAASTLTSAATTGLFKVIGLDEGTYYLEETKAPTEEYNKLTAPIELTITADTTNGNTFVNKTTTPKTLTALAVSLGANVGTNAATGAAANLDDGIVNVTVNNKKGSTLPSTGGMGTTLFYVGGGALALGAGVLLVTKKRMANK